MQARTLKETLSETRKQKGGSLSIKQALIVCADYYLNVENPEPATKGEAFLRFFTHRGDEGRKRAIYYKRDLLNSVQFTGEAELLKQVWSDLSNDVNGALSTSKQFRLDLLIGLEEHFGLSEAAIHKKQSELQKIYYAPVAGHATVHYPEGYFETMARISLLSNPVKSIIDSIKENKGIRLSRSDEDAAL